MTRTVLKYELLLLSDTCCASGSGNGIDVDVAASFDDVGLPIIPAKRLRGLLREQAFFLANNGGADISDVLDLFGESGRPSRLYVSDANIKNADMIGNELKKSNYSPREVAQIFTAKRAQTAIDENGVAKASSLRTIETVKKGLVFFGKVEITDPKGNDKAIIQNAFKLLRSIGMDKHRGLGEVSCKTEVIDVNDVLPNVVYERSGGEYEMKYKLTLLSDVALMLNSPIQNPDYISGSLLQGAFAKYFCNENFFNEMFFSDLKFGNAYISDGKKDFRPAPLSLFAVKNEGDKVYSVADGYEKESDKQYVSYGGYISVDNGSIERMTVKRGTDYHINKGQTNSAERTFFNARVIRGGQVFSGSIFGTKKSLEAIKACGCEIKLGASISAQYGRCKIEFGDPAEVNGCKFEKGDTVVATLLSNAIVVDDFGTNSALVKDLVSIIGDWFEIVDNKVFAYTETVGGYNAKWGLPKHQYIAFSKGTTLVLKCNKDIIFNKSFIGLLNSEGYGRIEIRKQSNSPILNVVSCDTESEKAEVKYEYAKEYVDMIEKNQTKNVFVTLAIDTANELHEKFSSRVSPSASMRLLSLMQSLRKSNATDLKEQYKAKIIDLEKNKGLYDLADEIAKKFEEKRKDDEYFELYLRTLIGRYKECNQTVSKNNLKGENDE